jgi:hypothetical protein
MNSLLSFHSGTSIMSAKRLTTVATLTALLGMALGCGAPSKPAAGGGAAAAKSTDPELNKSMTLEEIAALRPSPEDAKNLESMDAEITQMVGALSDAPIVSGPAKAGIKNKRVIFTGTVLEKSPEGAETPFLVLDGGNHREKQYTAKCYFAAAEKASLQDVKPQDSVRVEGVTDTTFNELVLEFKECVLKPASKPGEATGAAEKKPATDDAPAKP